VADETVEGTQADAGAGGGTAAGAPSPSPDAAATEREATHQRQIESLQGQIRNLEGTLQALANLGASQPQPQGQPQQGGQLYIPPATRARLRQEGLSDQEIDANGPLIVPFLRAVAPEIMEPLGQVSSRVELLQAEREFAYWDVLKDDALKLQREANRPVSLWEAYREAFVRNPEKIAEAVTSQKAAASSRAKDATAMGSLGGSRAYSKDDRVSGALTREKVAELSGEDRKKLWEELGG
jgi:hypothetical protein